MNVLESHLQNDPQEDWCDEEQESELGIETIGRDLEQAQLVVATTYKEPDLQKNKGYESDNNAIKSSKLKLSSREIKKHNG